MRRRCIGFLHHALDLFKLFHQMKLRGQAASGINQHHVLAARFARSHGVKSHSGGVTAFLADDLDGIAVRPHRQLFARCGPEGIGCSQQHRRTIIGQVFSELTNGCGLTRAIHTGHHDDGGLLLSNHQRLFERLEQLRQRFGQYVSDGDGVRHAAAGDPALDFIEQIVCGLDAGVGHQQGGFEVFVQRIVDLRPAENRRNAGAGLAQT